ncbi:MAG: hypothetical protein OXR66_01045 [Candidatus Woesearchaeota archaeon]|nr:hypothetical protein [Candidatus Woesearchaeota archaeon]
MGELQDRMRLLTEEKSRRKRLVQLRNETIKKAAFLHKKNVIETHDVYQLIRSFFKGFLGKEYEFTINELREELKHVYITHATRGHINEILKALEGLEYADVQLQHEQLVALLELFTVTVKELVRMHTAKANFFTKLKAFFTREDLTPDVIIAELPVIEDDNALHVRMHTLVEKCYAALERHNARRAKAAYEALLNEYADLETSDREHFYQLIEQTYRDLQHRSG